MRKKLSLETLNFIENVVVQYDLEKNLIENDPLLEKKLESAQNPEERRVVKFLYSQKIKEYLILKKPLEEISASIAIIKIIEKLINKEITFNDLDLFLKAAMEKLNIDSKTIKEVSQSIKNNEKIIEDLAKDVAGDYSMEEGFSVEQKEGALRGINQELL
ncbi:MAG: hypothetical protein PHW71_00080 [Candidatus Pacebacteria bacterium]|nr:hypothetical protein [Candidatus Paceibacterota bacterium]MDD5555154.1 hypothetical protein [Candidatus Paceibacterota bacterium]